MTGRTLIGITGNFQGCADSAAAVSLIIYDLEENRRLNRAMNLFKQFVHYMCQFVFLGEWRFRCGIKYDCVQKFL